MKTRRSRWTSPLLPVAFAVLSPLMVQGQGGGWTNIGPGHPPVWNILFAPQGTGTIFIGSEGGGIRKSVDNGVTWSAADDFRSGL